MIEFSNIKEYERYIMHEYGDKIAYRFTIGEIVREVTYKRLVGKAEGIARKLREQGVKRRTIALIGKTSCEWFTTYLGILASNNIVVSMDMKLMQSQKEDILNEIEAKYVFYDGLTEEQLNGIRSHCKTVEELYDMKTFVNCINELPIAADELAPSDELAQYMYTSGTTGESKSVMLSYNNILCVCNYQTAQPFSNGDVFLSVLSIHHCYELSCHLSALQRGCTICINDGLENILDNIKRYHPNIICLVPAIFEEILRSMKEWMKYEELSMDEGEMNKEATERFCKTFGDHIIKVLCGGAPMRSELPKEASYFRMEAIQGYGMTEMCGHVVVNMNTLAKPESVGIPFRYDVEVKIADDDEILVKGPNLMLGYYKQDSESLFTKDGFYKTGDLGKIDDDGYLFITGRKNNVILLNNGENVYPEELELYVSAIRGVNQAVIFQWCNQIAVMIYPNENFNIAEIDEEIKQFNRKLAAYKRITKIFYRDTPFPMTPSGKIRRNVFLKEFSEQKPVQYEPLETRTEMLLGDIFKEVLNVKRNIGKEDNFFALGGNSLSALAVATKAGIAAQMVYEYPVLKELAKAIEQKVDQASYDENYVNELIQIDQNITADKPVGTILLTGATGFLGSHILYELIHSRQATVYCLVRTEGRLADVYWKYFKEELPDTVYEVLGDITEENLGIRLEEYTMLIDSIHTVIHAAANVRHVGDRDMFVKTNYLGTERVIELCKKANAPLHYISSYASSGIAIVPIHSDVEVFDEKHLYIGQNYKENVYVYTKYISERKILEERANGLRANIYRVGCLTSRRRDGVFQLNKEENGLRNRLRGVLKAGVYTDLIQSFLIDFTAVDECADAFVRLVYSGKLNNIYHVFNPNAITVKDLGIIGETALKKVSNITFTKIMKEHADDKEISEYAFYSLMSMKSKPVSMQCALTYLALSELSFRWGVNTIDYIRNFMSIDVK